MNFDEYMVEAARTDGKFFYPDVVPAAAMQKALVQLMAAVKTVDMVKKGLFYGKQSTDLAKFVSEVDRDEDYQVDPDYIHAILGILTEGGELGEILWKGQLFGDIEQQAPAMVDESGDGMWYYGKLFRKLGVRFAEVAWKNIEKLARRFPDKFTPELAITHRDDAAEKAVFL